MRSSLRGPVQVCVYRASYMSRTKLYSCNFLNEMSRVILCTCRPLCLEIFWFGCCCCFFCLFVCCWVVFFLGGGAFFGGGGDINTCIHRVKSQWYILGMWIHVMHCLVDKCIDGALDFSFKAETPKINSYLPPENSPWGRGAGRFFFTLSFSNLFQQRIRRFISVRRIQLAPWQPKRLLYRSWQH